MCGGIHGYGWRPDKGVILLLLLLQTGYKCVFSTYISVQLNTSVQRKRERERENTHIRDNANTKMIKKIKANIKNKENKQQQQQRDLNGRAYTVWRKHGAKEQKEILLNDDDNDQYLDLY